jgi:ketosteroid isomerase-like protein
MKTKLLPLVLVLVVAVTGFFWKARAASDGAAKLTRLEAEFAKATADHGLDGFMSYFADDAVDLPAGGPIISGKENIRKALGPWGADFSLVWTPVDAEMAASGDLGYTYGTYVFKENGKDGKPVTGYGKYTTVWKKQTDGSWKVAVDMGNTSPPPAGGQ